jgi:His-Xaa-Ser system protein HxsD
MADNPQNRRISRLIDLSLVCLPAVQRAAYTLSERFDVLLDRQSERHVELSICQQSGGPEPPSMAELDRLLLDFALRVDVEERTRDVRNAIVGAALRHGR